MKTQTNRKQSLIAGGLIGSAGIFISKLIGIFYVIPFEKMISDQSEMLLYSYSFNIYSYLISICLAGFPFAVATLVAKYHTKGEYQMMLVVKRLSLSVMAVFGFACMVFLMLTSGFFASIMGGRNNDPAFVQNLQTTLIIISISLFLVPILSSFRGFYQGLKQMEVYALSQVLEQITRVGFLLGISALTIYVFHLDTIWAVYFSVFSASFAAIAAITHMIFYDRKQMKELRRLARTQEKVSSSTKEIIFKELMFISIPYMFTAILGYSDTLINSLFMINGLNDSKLYGSMDLVEAIASVINMQVLKLLSIPTILAPGFCAAMIPHITASLTNKDFKKVKKHVRDCVDTVLYIGIPLCFCLFVYAKPIYGFMYSYNKLPEFFTPMEELDLYANILQWYSLEGFVNVLGPIFTSLLMAVGLRKEIIQNLTGYVIIKAVSTYPLIAWLGYPGAVCSAVLSTGFTVIRGMYLLQKRYQVNWQYTFRRVIVILLGCAGMYASAALLHLLGIYGIGEGMGKLQSFFELAILGGVGMLVYLGITAFFQLPQILFQIDIKQMIRRIRRS